jgi:hypothetical protein
MVLVLTTGLATPFSALLLLGELALSCALVYGVYRWHAVAAWLLFALLIVSALGAAAQPPQFQTPGMATFRIAFLVGFGVAFGRAAMAIRSFNKGAANA